MGRRALVYGVIFAQRYPPQGQAMGLEIIVKGACMWLHIHFESVTGLLDGCRG
jgi:hypothetical protein